MKNQVNFKEFIVDELIARKEDLRNDVERLADIIEFIVLTDDKNEVKETLKTLADCRFQFRTILEHLDDLQKEA